MGIYFFKIIKNVQRKNNYKFEKSAFTFSEDYKNDRGEALLHRHYAAKYGCYRAFKVCTSDVNGKPFEHLF
jgi:hypothetical protein